MPPRFPVIGSRSYSASFTSSHIASSSASVASPIFTPRCFASALEFLEPRARTCHSRGPAPPTRALPPGARDSPPRRADRRARAPGRAMRLVVHRRGITALGLRRGRARGEMLAHFGELLLHLLCRPLRVIPIEAHTRGALLQAVRAVQGGEAGGQPLGDARRARAISSSPTARAAAPVQVRMASGASCAINAAGTSRDVECAALLGDDGMEEHLQQQVAQVPRAAARPRRRGSRRPARALPRSDMGAASRASARASQSHRARRSRISASVIVNVVLYLASLPRGPIYYPFANDASMQHAPDTRLGRGRPRRAAAKWGRDARRAPARR